MSGEDPRGPLAPEERESCVGLRADWTSVQSRPLSTHTPHPVAVQRSHRAPAESQAAWWWATGVFAAITVGLWSWHAVSVLWLPEPTTAARVDEVPRDAATPGDEARVTGPAEAAKLPLETASVVDPRPPGPTPVDRVVHETSRTADVPHRARPELQRTAAEGVDLDLTTAPSSPLEIAALEESRLRQGRSRRPRSIAPTFLQLNSRPWSQVYLDGQFVGNTPLRGLRVLPGHYSVRLVNRELRMGKQFELLLHEGETVTRTEQLAAD